MEAILSYIRLRSEPSRSTDILYGSPPQSLSTQALEEASHSLFQAQDFTITLSDLLTKATQIQDSKRDIKLQAFIQERKARKDQALAKKALQDAQLVEPVVEPVVL